MTTTDCAVCTVTPLAYHHDMVPARAARVRSDIARDNAAVLGIGFGLAASLLVALGLLAVVVDGLVVAHGVAPSSLAPYVHCIVAGGGTRGLWRFAGFVALGLVAVMLQSLVLCRRVLAADLVEDAAQALEVVRGFVVSRLLEALRSARPLDRRFVLVAHQVDHGILSQLCRALSNSPVAPPRPCSVLMSPFGLGPSHRVEVDAVA